MIAYHNEHTATAAPSSISRTFIEEICEKRSQLRTSTMVFLINTDVVRNSLLAVNLKFLEKGPTQIKLGLPLCGATFDLNWGFPYVDINKYSDDVSGFEPPDYRFEDPASRDTWGYRFCPVENDEIPAMICELANIRIMRKTGSRYRGPTLRSQLRIVNL